MKKLLLSLLLLLGLSGQTQFSTHDEYVCNTAQFILGSGVAGTREVGVKLHLYYWNNTLNMLGIVRGNRSFYFRVDERLLSTTPTVVAYRGHDTKDGFPVGVTVYYSTGRAVRTVSVNGDGNVAFFYVKYLKTPIL